MKAQRHNPNSERQEGPAGWRAAWSRFWFAPSDPVGLHRLRVLSGVFFITWVLGFVGQQEALLGLNGWFDYEAYKQASRLQEGVPAPFGWSIFYLAGTNSDMLHGFYWGSVAVIGLFTLGFCTRITSILNWVVIVSFTANPAIAWDADFLLVILAFYLMIGYVWMDLFRSGQSPAAHVLGSADHFVLRNWLGGSQVEPRESIAANLAVRMMQVHFAIIICTSGLHKLQFGDWWAGAGLWYPLFPGSQMSLERIRELSTYGSLLFSALSLGAYIGLAWQIGFPFFAWKPRWRMLLVGGSIIGWLATAFIFRLPTLGPVFFIGSLTYLTSAEWHRLGTLLRLEKEANHGSSRFPVSAPHGAAGRKAWRKELIPQ